MAYLEELGFKIYRLRSSKAEDEFLLYNKEKNQHNRYNKKRLFEFLFLELEELEFDYKEVIPRDVSVSNWLKTAITEEMILIDDVGFKPVNDLIYQENGKLYFNEFNTPEAMNPKNYIINKPMSFEELKENAPYHYKLFMNLHNHCEEAVKDTLMKLADKIKYPELKAQDCIIFYPGEGSGKGIFAKYVLNAIFGDYSRKVLMKRLNGDFNGFLEKALVLVLEEGKRDLELVETLKEAITEPTMLINEKQKKAIERPIYFLTFVFSNHMNPIDLGKRRGTYHLAHSLGPDEESSQEVGRELCENLPNETKTLLHYLHNLDFEHQQALKPFKTIAKNQVNELNKNPMELFFDTLITYPSLKSAIYDLYQRAKPKKSLQEFELELITKKDGQYIAKEFIKEAYNNFCDLEGFKSNLIRHNKDIAQLWALFKVPSEFHKRILISHGVNSGRRLEHINYDYLNKKIVENLLKDPEEE